MLEIVLGITSFATVFFIFYHLLKVPLEWNGMYFGTPTTGGTYNPLTHSDYTATLNYSTFLDDTIPENEVHIMEKP